MRKLLLAMGLVLAVPSAADAAQWVATPVSYATTSDGPFFFSWKSTGLGGMAGAAYRRSDEPGWHRCQPAEQSLTVPPLPVGTFYVDITDDFLPGSPMCDQASPPPTTIGQWRITVSQAPTAPAPVPTPQPSAPVPQPAPPVTTAAPVAKPRESDCSRSRRLVLLTHAKTATAKKAYKRKATKKRKAAYKKAQRVELAARRLRNINCS